MCLPWVAEKQLQQEVCQCARGHTAVTAWPSLPPGMARSILQSMGDAALWHSCRLAGGKGINDLFLESRAYLMLSVPCLTGTPRAA